ncbi:MAG: YihA family ribosome biogenesis GTP-binding protein [Bacteroidales bacterium]|nr:YihA family ribosome biogenesis GTP-binding protein [Bacteroidales bacterium]
MRITKATFAGSSTTVQQKPVRKLAEFAFIGRSNVGKSSLINMLTGNGKLAKTSQTPGKTQLVNHFLVNDAWYLVDLPGYGYAKLPDCKRAALRHMIWDYINHSEEMVMLFVLLDSRHDMQQVDLAFISELGEKGVPIGLVFTKADKQGPTALAAQVEKNKARLLEEWEELPPVFVTSSRTGLGKEDIVNYIGTVLETL